MYRGSYFLLYIQQFEASPEMLHLKYWEPVLDNDIKEYN
jgi:hypothetical protein